MKQVITVATMIKAVVRNGNLVVDHPIDLPDGTVLSIPIPPIQAPPGSPDDESSDTPEAIDAWLRWYEEFEPVEFTESERATRDAARADDRKFELSTWDERSRQLEERLR